MNKYISSLLVTLAFASSCTNDNIGIVEESNDQLTAKIYRSPEGAIPGEILVKFKPSANTALDGKAAQTRSINNQIVLTRSGLTNTDKELDAVAAYELKRVFPIDNSREALTRESGMNLWYVVRFDENADLATVARGLAATGEIDKIEFSHSIRQYRTKEGQLSRFVRSIPYSRSKNSAEQVRTLRNTPFNDPLLPNQWNMHNEGEGVNGIKGMVAGSDINAYEAWEMCAGDPSIIVAVLDEGVMHSHPDLNANMWVNPKESFNANQDADGNGYVDDVHGYNFVRNRGILTWDSPFDTGHGTHVAGMVAAVNNNGQGISSIAGGTGNGDGVRIMSCQLFDGQNVASTYEEAQAIKYAADNGAVILQCSWGFNSGYTSFPDQPGFNTVEEWSQTCALQKESLDYFIHNAGSPNGVIDGGVAIFAGGNEGSPQAGYPGAHVDYISVASMAGDFTTSTFSNYSRHIGLAAPGGDVDFHQDERGMILSTMPPLVAESGYGYMEGTSMACPQVSGSVALALSYAAKNYKHFKADKFRELILNSTRQFDDAYYSSEKEFYYYFMEFGTNSKSKMNLINYRGKMGTGYIDAANLMNMVADNANGVAMRIPNVRVGVAATTSVDMAQYYAGGANKTFTVSGANSAIAEVRVEGTTLVVTGKAEGSTSILVKAEGVEQVVSIVVRNGGGNGWL